MEILQTTAMKLATEKAVANQAEASQEASIARITEDTEELTSAVNAAAGKSSRQRHAAEEDALVEASRVKHVAIEKVQFATGRQQCTV